jgi:prepilin-type N-terminal cleavage/methylation domain-containing protein
MSKHRDINPGSPNGGHAGTGPQSVRAGFTLVEMIVVVTIIAILAMILFPTVAKIWELSRINRTSARLQQLGQGCGMYKNDNHAYPGQANSNLLFSPINTAVGSDPAGVTQGISGSQILAASLFYGLDANYTETTAPTFNFNKTHGATTAVLPTEHYAPLHVVADSGSTTAATSTYTNQKTDLLDYTPNRNAAASATNATMYWTVSDQWGKQNMPILYYPSRPGMTGSLAQYLFNDNYYLTMNYSSRSDKAGQTRYWSCLAASATAAAPAAANVIGGTNATPPVVNNPPLPGSFYNDICDNRIMSNNLSPYKDGEFLLIAPGPSGVYGAIDNIKFGF